MHTLIIDEKAAVFCRGDTRQVTVKSGPIGVAMDHRILTAGRAKFRRAVYTSRLIRCSFPINDVVASWNVALPKGTGFIVQLRLGRRRNDTWTAFYYLGSWGMVPKTGVKKNVKDGNGRVHTDYFHSDKSFDRVQYRLLLFSTRRDMSPTLRRFALSCSYTLKDKRSVARHRKTIRAGAKKGWARRLNVPFRSQRAEDPKIAGSVCSPTSVAMVMAYHGIDQPTRTLCDIIWDAEYKIFGNWTRAVQGAYLFGVPGYLERFAGWPAAKRYIGRGLPIIASIRAPEPGMLRGAPYRTSNGHLLVIAGFDKHGNVHVNDPYGKTRRTGLRTYAKEDMKKVWLDHGGVGYVLLPPEMDGQPSKG